MTDLRSRLADALQRELDEHGYEDDDEKRWQVAYHFADALLSLPGIAIVELPQPDEKHDGWVVSDHALVSVFRGFLTHDGNSYDPADAREVAAALLAAADAVDAQGVSD